MRDAARRFISNFNHGKSEKRITGVTIHYREKTHDTSFKTIYEYPEHGR